MPCYDPETHERPVRLEKKVHRLTGMLVCGFLETSHPEVLAANKDLAAWWQDHQTHDARVQAAQEKRDRGEKLTPQERGLLWTRDDISY